MMMSERSQPRPSISARVAGRNPAGGAPAGFCSTLENTGGAVCTPAIRPDPSPYVDGDINLGPVALNQPGGAVARPRHLTLEVGHRGDARAVRPHDRLPRPRPD